METINLETSIIEKPKRTRVCKPYKYPEGYKEACKQKVLDYGKNYYKIHSEIVQCELCYAPVQKVTMKRHQGTARCKNSRCLKII